MPSPIQEIMFSLDWAKQRIQVFHKIVGDYLGSDPHPQGLIGDLNPQGNDIYEVTVRFIINKTIPLDITLIYYNTVVLIDPPFPK